MTDRQNIHYKVGDYVFFYAKGQRHEGRVIKTGTNLATVEVLFNNVGHVERTRVVRAIEDFTKIEKKEEEQ